MKSKIVYGMGEIFLTCNKRYIMKNERVRSTCRMGSTAAQFKFNVWQKGVIKKKTIFHI